MTTHEIVEEVRSSIGMLCNSFSEHPHLILTEDDMRVRLCALLLPRFGAQEHTEDGEISASLHSEVRWYGRGTLNFRSDIVLLDVSTLCVKNATNLKLPTKGYRFNVPKAIIELKLRRVRGNTDDAFRRNIEDDCAKLQRVVEELSDVASNIFCCVVVFDKKHDIGPLELPNPPHVYYVSKPTEPA